MSLTQTVCLSDESGGYPGKNTTANIPCHQFKQCLRDFVHNGGKKKGLKTSLRAIRQTDQGFYLYFHYFVHNGRKKKTKNYFESYQTTGRSFFL